MTLTFPVFSFSSLIAAWRKLAVTQPSPEVVPMTDAGDTRDDRAFAMDMLARHPEAIDSEMGLMMLMTRWPMHL